jgi:hypothetical protein
MYVSGESTLRGLNKIKKEFLAEKGSYKRSSFQFLSIAALFVGFALIFYILEPFKPKINTIIYYIALLYAAKTFPNALFFDHGFRNASLKDCLLVKDPDPYRFPAWLQGKWK